MPETPDCRWPAFATAYVAVLALLNLPSALLWAAPEWRLVDHEYDFFLGQAWAAEWFGASSLLVGRVLHSVLFLAAGLLFARLCWPWLTGRAEPGKLATGLTVAGALLVSLAGLPWVSPDVFYYLAKGWLQVGYGLNPYQFEILHAQAPTDPLFLNVHPDFREQNIDYGPVFQSISQVAVWVGGGEPKASLFAFKLMMAAAVVLTGWVASRTVLILYPNPSRARLAFFATAANPVALFALVTCAHNDALIMLAMAAAVWLLMHGQPMAGGIALGLGFCIKYIPVLLLPVLLVTLWKSSHLRTSPRRASAMLLAGFVLTALLFHLPQLASWDNLGDLVGGGFHLFRNNAFYLVAAVSTDWAGQFHHVILWAMRGFFVLFYLGLLAWWCRQVPLSPANLTERSLLVLVGYLLIASVAIHEWYLAWWLPLAFVLPDRALWRGVLALQVLFLPLIIWTKDTDGLVNVGVNLLVYVLCLGLAYGYYTQKRHEARQPETAGEDPILPLE